MGHSIRYVVGPLFFLPLVLFLAGHTEAAKVRGVAFDAGIHAALVDDPWTGNTWLGLKWTSGVSEVTGVAPGTQSGMSLNQVQAALLPGGAFEGWRYATYGEVTTLLAAAFGLPAGVNTNYFTPHPYLPAVAAFSNTMDFLYRPEMPGMFANGIPVYPYGTSGVIPNGTGGLRFDAAQTQWTGHPWDVHINTVGQSVNATDAYSWIGHFLVLDEVPSPCEGVVCDPAPTACHRDGVCNEGSGQCEYEQKEAGETCEDTIACTIGNTCNAAGDCGTPSHAACSDGIPCTLDSCDPTSGCANVPSAPECNESGCPVGGDLNASGHLNVADIACIVLTSLSAPSSPPACLVGPISVADMNCSGGVTVADAQLLAAITLTGQLPAGQDTNQNLCHDACEGL